MMRRRRRPERTWEDIAVLREGDVTLVRRSPLFTGMSDSELASVLAECDEQVYPAGHRVVVEGMEGHDFFIVLDGEAAVTVEGWVVARLGPGEFFGETAPLRGVPRSASVVAMTRLRCLSLANDSVREVLEGHPRFTYNMLLGLADRIHATDARLRTLGVAIGRRGLLGWSGASSGSSPGAGA